MLKTYDQERTDRFDHSCKNKEGQTFDNKERSNFSNCDT